MREHGMCADICVVFILHNMLLFTTLSLYGYCMFNEVIEFANCVSVSTCFQHAFTDLFTLVYSQALLHSKDLLR